MAYISMSSQGSPSIVPPPYQQLFFTCHKHFTSAHKSTLQISYIKEVPATPQVRVAVRNIGSAFVNMPASASKTIRSVAMLAMFVIKSFIYCLYRKAVGMTPAIFAIFIVANKQNLHTLIIT